MNYNTFDIFSEINLGRLSSVKYRFELEDTDLKEMCNENMIHWRASNLPLHET